MIGAVRELDFGAVGKLHEAAPFEPPEVGLATAEVLVEETFVEVVLTEEVLVDETLVEVALLEVVVLPAAAREALSFL